MPFKKTITLFIAAFVLLASTFYQSSAGGVVCSVDCGFSSCTIVACDGQYVCGCYFGIATCKCEENKKVIKKVDKIAEFSAYATQINAPGLIGIATLLQSMDVNNYDAFMDSYRIAVTNLSDHDRSLLDSYVNGAN